MRPTKKQVKEFWEGYGFKQQEKKSRFPPQAYYSPNGEKCYLPSIDLNNLFKYAVLEALKAIALRGYCPPIMKLFQLWYDELVTQTGDSNNIEQAALALFWVLREVKEKEGV